MLSSSPAHDGPAVALINPLGVALAHYQRELISTLEAAGTTVSAASLLEPSAGVPRRQWVGSYVSTLRSTGRLPVQHRILCWPVLGYLDPLIVAACRSKVRTSLIVHDPSPLVRAAGYSWASRKLYALAGADVDLLVHSRAAADEADRLGLPVAAVLPHPMLEPQRRQQPVTGETRVVVLGQYKPDRDLGALKLIADHAPTDWALSIKGRGWPPVRGWHVEDRFLSEAAFDNELRSADVVVVPYRRFFQSGVAVRCLELGTACVGPQESSLSELFGSAGTLVVNGDWVGAVQRAVEAAPDAAVLHARRQHQAVVEAWRSWLLAGPHASRS